jgi:hypothetical protein
MFEPTGIDFCDGYDNAGQVHFCEQLLPFAQGDVTRGE